MNDLGIDVNDYQETSFQPLPAGEYKAIIIKAELVQTKNGTGKRIAYQIQIIEGPYKSRIIPDGFNIVNDSEIAQNIGRSQFAACRVAVGAEPYSNLEQIVNKPCYVVLGVKPGSGSFADSNQVKTFKPINTPKLETKSAPVDDDLF